MRIGPFATGRAALAATLLLCGSCARDRAPAAPPPAPVTVSPAAKKTVPLELRAIGNVEASSVVEVRAQVGGIIEKVQFEEGQVVREGAVLFTIDPRPFRLAVAGAEAKLARDRVLAQNASSDADRYSGLIGQGIVTREQYDRSVANAAAAEALTKADEAELENARIRLGYSTITAPITGRTGSLLVHAGNLIEANDDKALVLLRRTSPVWVTFSVPERNLSEIRRRSASGALEVRCTPPGEGAEPHRGTLTFMDNAVDTDTGTIRLKATFSNEDAALWPGQFVDVVVVLASEANAIVVPSEAVQNGQQGAYVFVVKDDSTVESRPVEVERTVGTESVIAKGVTEGEKVVTEGQIRLVPGAKVSVKAAS